MKNTVARFLVAIAIVIFVVTAVIYATNSFLHVRSITVKDGELVVETSPTGRLAGQATKPD